MSITLQDRIKLLDEALEAMNPGPENIASRIILFRRMVIALQHQVKKDIGLKESREDLIASINEFRTIIRKVNEALNDWNLGSEVKRQLFSQLRKMHKSLDEIQRSI